jgi:hypothetical protein
MRKLAEVQKAKDLMHEAMEWSEFIWLFKKSTVRETADQAKAALDRLERAVKARWTDEAKAAYKSLTAKAGKAASDRPKNQHQPQTLDPQLLILVAKVVDADNAAESAGLEAENTFDEAERQWCISLAREGCSKAIHAWALREKAIRKAESVEDRLRSVNQAASRSSNEPQ